MSSSTSAGKQYIKKVINGIINQNDRVLDLGCGRGTYARLIDKECYKVGVDAVDYEKRFGLSEWYNEFHIRDIRDTDFIRQLGRFKIAIAGDVLEHLKYEDARKVLTVMEEVSEVCIVAFPYIYEQKAIGKGNWEFHEQSDLTREIIGERYPELMVIKEYKKKCAPWNGGAFYGYYIWKKGM